MPFLFNFNLAVFHKQSIFSDICHVLKLLLIILKNNYLTNNLTILIGYASVFSFL